MLRSLVIIKGELQTNKVDLDLKGKDLKNLMPIVTMQADTKRLCSINLTDNDVEHLIIPEKYKTNFPSLRKIIADNNAISSVNLNCTALEHLSLANNSLTEVTFGSNTFV